jgi:hypothetical protein
MLAWFAERNAEASKPRPQDSPERKLVRHTRERGIPKYIRRKMAAAYAESERSPYLERPGARPPPMIG